MRNDCRRSEIVLLNCRSLTDKATVLSALITEKSLDLLLLTETWRIPNYYLHLNLLSPSGYSYLANDTTTFVYLVLKICGSLCTMLVVLLYRPPKPISNFFNELLTLTCAMSSSVILIGDFNIHVDTDYSESLEFMSVLECFNFEQHVNFPTHSKGHTLDLVCTTGLCNVSVIGS